MQFLKISKDTLLKELVKSVGDRNVIDILHLNGLDRVPKIGLEFYRVCAEKIAESTMDDIDPSLPMEEQIELRKRYSQRKSSLLNSFLQDSDIFETAAMQTKQGWKLLDKGNTLTGYLRIPETITIPDSDAVLGNKSPTPSVIYDKVMKSLNGPPYSIDLSIFNSYSAARPSNIEDYNTNSPMTNGPMQWFRIPWGEVTLYSSISNKKMDFPVYPEEMSDGVRANYTQMPDLIYQYEPWQLYQSSGPREQDFTFDFHRDMWTGDHRDGKANELIRFCEANCYPEYKGSAVYVPSVTLYIAGKPLISGVMTAVTTDWDGPLGKYDGWYLHCKLRISITEVSKKPLSYASVMVKPLIG